MSIHLTLGAVGVLTGLSALSSKMGSQSRLFDRLARERGAAGSSVAPPVDGRREVGPGISLIPTDEADPTSGLGPFMLELSDKYQPLLSRPRQSVRPTITYRSFSDLPQEVREVLAIWARTHSFAEAEKRWGEVRRLFRMHPRQAVWPSFKAALRHEIGTGGTSEIWGIQMEGVGLIDIRASVFSRPTRIEATGVDLKGSKLEREAWRALGMGSE
jgi:hypothetical protein